ncbi:MAG: helix-turn-helix domain-containing protein [Candidatus Bipolaricaulota bacterium]|nr:helix-turn-helix domain-containing protein [Candidatus Bipolaricaulota bacterium]
MPEGKSLGGFLRPWQVAQYLGIPIEKVYEMMESGELPAEKIEGRWRVDLAKLEKWLDEDVSPEDIEKLAQRLDVPQEKVRDFFKQLGRS